MYSYGHICNFICVKDASTCAVNVCPHLWYIQSMFYIHVPMLLNVTKTLHSGHCDALPRFPFRTESFIPSAAGNVVGTSPSAIGPLWHCPSWRDQPHPRSCPLPRVALIYKMVDASVEKLTLSTQLGEIPNGRDDLEASYGVGWGLGWDRIAVQSCFCPFSSRDGSQKAHSPINLLTDLHLLICFSGNPNLWHTLS